MWRRASVLLLLLPAFAEAHPGHGPEVVQVRGLPNQFDPARVTVGVNDTVVWQWTGAYRNHSVTAHDSSFDSDPGNSSPNHPEDHQFAHVFTKEGTFGYHCKVHPDMTGEVEVVAVAGDDVEPPRLSGVRISRAGRRFRVHFTSSEAADVLARIRKGRRALRSFDLTARPGPNRARLPSSGLGAGRYRVVLTAFDAADNRSDPRGAPFRVRPR